METTTKTFKEIFTNIENDFDFEIVSENTFKNFERTIVDDKGLVKGQIIKLTNLKTGEYMKFGFSTSIHSKTENNDLSFYMSNILQECQGVFNAGEFRFWADDFGYNNDSIKDLKLYKKICKIHKNFKRVVGEHYNDLIWCEIDA